MGAALVFPIVVFVVLGLIWFATAAKRTREQARDEATLPLDPYERRQEELRRLVREHEEAEPAEVSPGQRAQARQLTDTAREAALPHKRYPRQ